MPYIYEFLYRGGETPAWHLILRDPISNVETVYNMQQAAAAGYSLPTILSSLDTTTLTELEKARALLQEALGRLDGDAPADAPVDPGNGLSDAPTAPSEPSFWDRVKSFLGL